MNTPFPEPVALGWDYGYTANQLRAYGDACRKDGQMECRGCRGRGEVGAAEPDGSYSTEQCPFCKGSGREPAPAQPMGEARDCTCHPDDEPPVPCPQKFAYSDCMRAALTASQAELEDWRHTNKIDELYRELAASQERVTVVQDALDYLHGLTGEQYAELRCALKECKEARALLSQAQEALSEYVGLRSLYNAIHDFLEPK